jgi:hypothetical protein
VQIDERGSSDDLRDQIERLEVRIEALAERAERCRKIIVFATATIVVGALVLAAIVVGALEFSPVAMICGIAAVIGGIVVRGSNRSTMDEKGLGNFFGLYLPLVDSWQVLDNSDTAGPRPMASGDGKTVRVLGDAEAWRTLTETYHG